MIKILPLFILLIAGVLVPFQFGQKKPPVSNTSGAVATSTETPSFRVAKAEAEDPEEEHPVRLLIPSIGLDSPIEYVGINEKGEMAVPDGSTNRVGWYQHGTVPGETGSAVLAAHVYAAFSELDKLPVGSEVVILTKGGAKRRFAVAEREIYPLAQVPLERLFNRADDEWLNLITCAGTYLPHRSTYSKRLVLYARFIGES